MLFTRQLAAAAAAAVVVANSVVVVVVLHFGIKQSAPALDRHERKDANGKWWLEGAKRESKSIRTSRKQAEGEAGAGRDNRSEQKARNQRHRAEFMCICDLSAEAERGVGWGTGWEVDRLDMSCYLTALVTIVGQSLHSPRLPLASKWNYAAFFFLFFANFLPPFCVASNRRPFIEFFARFKRNCFTLWCENIPMHSMRLRNCTLLHFHFSFRKFH